MINSISFGSILTIAVQGKRAQGAGYVSKPSKVAIEEVEKEEHVVTGWEKVSRNPLDECLEENGELLALGLLSVDCEARAREFYVRVDFAGEESLKVTSYDLALEVRGKKIIKEIPKEGRSKARRIM